MGETVIAKEAAVRGIVGGGAPPPEIGGVTGTSLETTPIITMVQVGGVITTHMVPTLSPRHSMACPPEEWGGLGGPGVCPLNQEWDDQLVPRA